MTTDTHPPTTAEPDMLALAQECVMCGICVPHCPTFALSGNEADGPRGRISMVIGLNNGRLRADGGVVRHIDSCLGCRACEDVCPSKVQYGRLLDATRSALAKRHFSPDASALDDEAEIDVGNLANQPNWRWLRDQVLSQRARLRAALATANVFARLGVGHLIGKAAHSTLGGLWRNRPTDALGPKPRFGSHRAQSEDARKAPVGRVGLFVGCTGEAMNARAVNAAIRVLTRLGYDVVAPEKQGCCGAMHRHGGAPEQADALASTNARVFAEAQVDSIVVVGSGCAAELYEQLPDVAVREITAFLADLPDEAWPPLIRNEDLVAIHTPCSQVRVLGEADATRALLERIPGIRLRALAENDRCCGAAGMHVLLYPEQAEQLRGAKIADATAIAPSRLASANIGCALHLAAGLAEDEAGQAIRVLQPVELIDQALGAA